jgi:hypothetical protein
VHRHEHRRGERRRGRAGFHQQRDLDGVPTPAVVRSVVLNSIWLCCIHSFATIDYSTVSCFERKSMELRWLISSRQTEDKTTGCNSVTTQSQLSHNSVTTQSQLSHNSVTAHNGTIAVWLHDVYMRCNTGFERVSLAPGQSLSVPLAAWAEDFSVVDARGVRWLRPGGFHVQVGDVEAPAIKQVSIAGAPELLEDLSGLYIDISSSFHLSLSQHIIFLSAASRESFA